MKPTPHECCLSPWPCLPWPFLLLIISLLSGRGHRWGVEPDQRAPHASLQAAAGAAHPIPHPGRAGSYCTVTPYFMYVIWKIKSWGELKSFVLCCRAKSPGSWSQAWSISRRISSWRKQTFTEPSPTHAWAPTGTLTATGRPIHTWWLLKWVLWHFTGSIYLRSGNDITAELSAFQLQTWKS